MKRRIGIVQATALNMIDMVGIGPFIVMSGVISAMGGPQCIAAWIAGALLALVDSQVWSELGARFPDAGGSYAFLRRTFDHLRFRTLYTGELNAGKAMSFLFIWQTMFQASLVVASAAIGIANYVEYLLHPNVIPPEARTWESRMIGAAAVVLVVIALYRKIETVGKLSVLMWVAVLGTMMWIIVAGITHFNPAFAFTYPAGAWSFDASWFTGLGNAMQNTVYAFLGYYNVCHLGSEITKPEKNIPRSMLISILGIAVLYCAMQLSVLGIMPWQEAAQHKHLMSLMIEYCYGSTAAQVMTVLILFVAFTSLFAVVLGYSRIPYAAAQDGNFFSVFALTHPEKDFPHISLLVFGALSVVLSIAFNNIKDIVAMILTMRILVQFVGQSIGLLLYRRHAGADSFPYRMLLYPLPVLLNIAIWLWLFSSRASESIIPAFILMAAGLGVYIIRRIVEERRLTSI
ncbi:MAG: APC family permease [Candidatus Kapabacteria bacterium]|nr:APC family permease [Candidatus Kapabacteria bacterium]